MALHLDEGLHLDAAGVAGLAELDHVVVVQFWDVRSTASRKAMPDVDRIARTRLTRGLVVVGVHQPRYVEEMARFITQAGISYPLCVDGGPTASDYVSDSFPDYCLIDRFGVLRYADLADAELEEAIDALLSEPGPLDN